MFDLYKKSRLVSVRVDPRQLRRGITVEMEHTDNPQVAQIIAMDHLAEMPDYYTQLAHMERK